MEILKPSLRFAADGKGGGQKAFKTLSASEAELRATKAGKKLAGLVGKGKDHATVTELSSAAATVLSKRFVITPDKSHSQKGRKTSQKRG